MKQTTVSRLSIRLTKYDAKILSELCDDYGETTTNIIKIALKDLYHSTKGNKNVITSTLKPISAKPGNISGINVRTEILPL